MLSSRVFVIICSAVIASCSISLNVLGQCVETPVFADMPNIPRALNFRVPNALPKFILDVVTDSPESRIKVSGVAKLQGAAKLQMIVASPENDFECDIEVVRVQAGTKDSSASMVQVTKTMMASSFLMARSKLEAAALVGMFAALSLPLPSSAQGVCELEEVTVAINLPKGVSIRFESTGPTERRLIFSVNGAELTKTPTTATKAPVTKAPVTKAPVTKAPVTKAPVTKAPVTNAPTTAGAVRAFNIQLVHLIAPAAAVDTAFKRAAARWGEVINIDLPNLPIPNGLSANSVCGNAVPQNQLPQVIDDLLIVTSLNPIDGVGRVLGSAGPCTVLQGTSKGLTRIGFMQFDTDDLQRMINDGSIEGVILHEMGHVIGVGTLWRGKGLIQGSGTNDPRFLGTNGNNALKKINDPVAQANIEADGGPGTAEGHWDDAKYKNELMTGFVSPNMKMSALTVESLIDLGYTVNINKADAFDLSTASFGRRQLRGEEDRELQTVEEHWDTMYTSYKVCDQNWQGPSTDSCSLFA